MTFYEPPPTIYQDPTQYTCWAAALESWISVTPNCPISWAVQTQEQAIDHWDMFTDSKNGLSKEGFKWMAAACGMNYKPYKKAKDMTGTYLDGKLKKRRYLYLFFAGGATGLGNGLAHAVVVYEISKPWSKNCTISVMDPWPGNGRMPGQPLTNYTKAKEVVVAWFEPGA